MGPLPTSTTTTTIPVRWGCWCMSCLGGESIHSTLSAPLINDLFSVLYSDWLSRCTFFPQLRSILARLALPRPLRAALLSFHKDITARQQQRAHLNVNADTNNKCTNKDYNIETEYMFAWNINSWSVIHRPLFFIYPFPLQPSRCLEGRPQSCL